MGAHDHLILEDETLSAARAGDMRACEAIYRQFERPVYTLALRLCGQREEALDVLQDSFIHAFEKLEQFRGDSPFWPWLKQVVVSQALMRLRREKRFRLWQRSAREDEPEQPGPDGMDRDLASALAELPATSRSVVWLYDVEGYTHEEIARLMGRSLSFSKSQLARAHARLRAKLEQTEEAASCTQVAKIY